MPAPGALLAALALLLAGGASAAAMPGTDRSVPDPPTQTDRTTGQKPATTGTTGTTGTTETTTATEPGGQPTTATTPVRPEKPEEGGRSTDRPLPPEHAEDDKPRQEKLDGKAEPPALGRRVVVGESRGAVLVRLPGTAADQALEHLEDVPVGSIIDTRRGAVVLHSAIDARGTQQQAFFFGGRFEVRQGADGYVDVHLRGRPGTCPARSGRARSARAAAPRRPQRKLWGQDDHGRFRTHGRDAVATVRGTHWVVRERCDGTKVSVTWGAVDVLDKRTGRTVRVKGGRSYLARRAR